MARKNHRLLLWAAATDKTFKLITATPPYLLGKCIHCRRKLSLSLRGEALGHATLEHIVPRNHGGGDDVVNLAVACAKCNALKGSRIDVLPSQDPKFLRVIEGLQQERDKRMRLPLETLSLPDLEHQG